MMTSISTGKTISQRREVMEQGRILACRRRNANDSGGRIKRKTRGVRQLLDQEHNRAMHAFLVNHIVLESAFYFIQKASALFFST